MASVESAFKRTVGIIAIVLLVISLVLLLVGEWGPSIGVAGLMRNIGTAAGCMLVSASFVAFFILLAANIKDSHVFAGEGRISIAPVLLRETAGFLLACVVYGGSGFVALGVFAGVIDGAAPGKIPVALFVWAVCIAVVVLYRRYRKKHPMKYEMLGWVGVFLVLGLIVVAGIALGIVLSKDAAADLLQGPKTELCRLAEVDENRATGRNSGFRQDTLDLTFKTLDEREIHISVAENDRPGLSDIVEAEGVVWLTYFPESGVYVSARPGIDDYRAAGGA